MAQPPPSARRNYLLSALIAQRAAREALKVRQSFSKVLTVVLSHQMTQARTSQAAVDQMLLEQQVRVDADAILRLSEFTTEPVTLDRMLRDAQTDQEFQRIVASITQDAARAAESVSVAVRPNVAHVRFVNLPCCSRCAILAGRVYRWSDGFQRHPGCDCSMIPTTVASPLAQDPDELARSGQVRGLSKADLQALNVGADLGRIVNVRRQQAGLLEAGHALRRGGRPTPAGIYRAAEGDRDVALRLLAENRYIT